MQLGEEQVYTVLTGQHRFLATLIALTLAGMLCAAAAGLGNALLLGLLSPDLALADRTLALQLSLAIILSSWASHQFLRQFKRLKAVTAAGTGPAAILPLRPGRDYWSFYLLHALLSTLLLFSATGLGLNSAGWLLAQLAVLQIAANGVAGLPGWLVIRHRLPGPLIKTDYLQPTLQVLLMLGCAIAVLLGSTMLLNYQWQSTGALGPVHMASWLTVVCAGSVLALFWIPANHRNPLHSGTPAGSPVQHNKSPAAAAASTTRGRLAGLLARRPANREANMRAVVDSAAEGIIVLDRHGRVVTYNPAAERLFGYTASEMCGRSLQPLLPQLFDHHDLLQPFSGERELEGIHRNGGILQLTLHVSPMSSGGSQLYNCLVSDISRRKLMELQLREAEYRFRDLVESAHDLVWTLDADGRISYINRACIDIYGYQPGEMLNHYLHEYRSPEHAPLDRDAVNALLSGEDRAAFETVHLDRENRPHFLEFSARSHKDEHGHVLRISGTTRDVTEHKAFQHQLSYNAEHDPLTGLFNRSYFQEELKRTVARTARSAFSCALFFVDVDQFKYINDTLGHTAGDRLLVDIATLLSSHVRDGDLLARFGGDEFMLLLYNIDQHDVLKAAENFRSLCDDYRFSVNDSYWNVSVSIGIAMIDHQTSSAQEVLSHADLACNTAKQQGRNRVNLYNPADLGKADMQADLSWATRVREMLENDRFKLVYQPIADCNSGQVLEYEVLVRMVCDDGQVILPGGFMPAAERFGLIHSVDRWIVRRAILQLTELHVHGHTAHFSINLSGKAFEDSTLLPMIRELLDNTGLDPSFVTFEITETAAIANLAAAEEFISALKDIGCQFALDDFGSGFSSFAYLKHLPVDKLKIDGAFVKGMAHSSVDQAMVESMNQVAHALGKLTVAECVENEEALLILRDIGVDRVQGNHIGQPAAVSTQPVRVSAQAAEELLVH